jgi:hypothetical protein
MGFEKTEKTRRQKTEDRGQKSEDRGQKSEERSGTVADKPPESPSVKAGGDFFIFGPVGT